MKPYYFEEIQKWKHFSQKFQIPTLKRREILFYFLLRELRQIAGGKRNPWAYANRKGRTICAAAFDMFNRLILEFGRTTNTDLTGIMDTSQF